MGLMDLFKAKKNQQLTEQLALEQQKNAALTAQFNSLLASIPKEKAEFDALAERTRAVSQQLAALTSQQASVQQALSALTPQLEQKRTEHQKLVRDTEKLKRLYDQYKAAVKGYEIDPDFVLPDILPDDALLPVIEVELNCMNMRDLRKRYQQNQREIQRVCKRYEGRYTTKANIAIYQLMIIAMEAELQNALASLAYGKLEKASTGIKAMIQRYYEVAVEGNQIEITV